MNKIRRIAFTTATVTLLGGFAVPDVSAQTVKNCACVLPSGGPASPVGTVTGVVGQVMISQPDGFVPAEVGGNIELGSKLIIGPQSRAVVAFGPNCPINIIPENIDLSILPENGNACVRLSQIDEANQLEDPNVTPAQAGLLGGMATGAAAGAVAAAISK